MDFGTDDILAEYPGAIPLSSGGQKVVYTIEHPQFGVCVLKIGKSSSSNALERVRREFFVLGELDSPLFPKSYELHEYSGGRFSIVEEKLSAIPLSDRLSDFASIDAASRIAAEILSGLRLLWDRRVIHRDIKPDNILIGASDSVHIIDLGIARLLDEVSLTHDMAPMGPCTPIYAAPEQLANRKGEINYRCDQFSLGIVYAQLLLGGRHPFDPEIVGTGESVLANIFSGTWAISSLPEQNAAAVLPILSRLLGPEPHQRYRDPGKLQQALQELI